MKLYAKFFALFRAIWFSLIWLAGFTAIAAWHQETANPLQWSGPMLFLAALFLLIVYKSAIEYYKYTLNK